jgi:hypothetical protein
MPSHCVSAPLVLLRLNAALTSALISGIDAEKFAIKEVGTENMVNPPSAP